MVLAREKFVQGTQRDGFRLYSPNYRFINSQKIFLRFWNNEFMNPFHEYLNSSIFRHSIQKEGGESTATPILSIALDLRRLRNS
jgi:hypothetical protein